MSRARSRARRKLRKVLVANRGEIAVRVIRTLRALGIRSVAVFSAADRDSLAVALADDAEPIGPAAAAESYLSIERLLDAARKHRADAIHPGYGFLSERAELAQAVEAAGFVFLGPTPQNIRRLGNKLEARAAMLEAGIGPAPGSPGALAHTAAARRFAARCGFPLLFKAAAGGGGRGIRIVRGADELTSAFRLAASEAQSAFGSPLLFAERYVEGARHVEVQVLGDGQGGARLFFERDCSIQRRLQKLVEETPSPAVTSRVRERLLAAALRVVRATRYRSAGTLEFLLSADGELYFLEMNTRIQVEHPVTEAVAGVDIVAEQIAVAEGACFGRGGLDEVVTPARGVAIELRVNAEDPTDEFRPASGRISPLHLPHIAGLRIDTALYDGLEVTPYYDSLLAKLIAWGADRKRALGNLRLAVAETVIGGIPTTLPVGAALLDDPDFAAGRYHCQFLAERLAREDFLAARRPAREAPEIAAALAFLTHQKHTRDAVAAAASPAQSAWRVAGRSPRAGGSWSTWEPRE